MRRGALAAALLGAALLAGCGGGAPTGAPPTAAAPAPTTESATAYLLETPEFSVGLPDAPTQDVQEIADLPGIAATTYSVARPTYAVAVAVIDYPADLQLGEPTAVLEGARDGAVGNVPGGVLQSSAPATVDGRPALDLVASVDQGGAYRARLVLDGQRLYQLITAGSEDRPAEHDAFAASLRLLT